MMDYLEKSLSGTCGKDPPEYLHCNKIQGNYCDEKFTYGFIYELRNYMQHRGFSPVNNKETKQYGEGNGRSGYLANISVGFNREELPRNSYKWKPWVKKELEGMTGGVPVPTCMFKYGLAVQDVFIRY